MKTRTANLALTLILLWGLSAPLPGKDQTMDPKTPKAPASVHGFSALDIDGKEQALAQYRGKVLLIVNTASKCGFTGQYQGLQELYERNRERGLVVLAFPSNDFLWQEPGSSKEIKEFCSTKFHITFPVMEKVKVKGKGAHPLYQYLTKESPFPGAISWNFNKFLVGRDGKVLARFGSKQEPGSPEILSALETALAQP